MSKINALEFGKYVQNQRNNLDYILKNRFKLYSSNNDLNTLVNDVGTIPVSHVSEDYWIDDDFDLRELANNPPFEGCKYVYGGVIYATPTANSLSNHDFPITGTAVSAGTVVVRSDGAIFDNRDGTGVTQTQWDISKDIISDDGTFSMRYILVYGYNNAYTDETVDSMNIAGYVNIKSMIFKNIKLKRLNFTAASNSLYPFMPDFIYCSDCNIGCIDIANQVNGTINVSRNIALNNSSIGKILTGSTSTSIESLTSVAFIHENLPSITFLSQIVSTSTLQAIIDHITSSSKTWSINTKFICDADITQSNDYTDGKYLTEYVDDTNTVKMRFTGSINMSNSLIYLKRIKRYTLDLSKATLANITGVVNFAKAFSSERSYCMYVNIIGNDNKDNKIDFSMNFVAGSQDYYLPLMISLQNLKYIFSQLKDLSGTGLTRTITVGPRVIELLPDEVAAAQAKGWTVS